MTRERVGAQSDEAEREGAAQTTRFRPSKLGLATAMALGGAIVLAGLAGQPASGADGPPAGASLQGQRSQAVGGKDTVEARIRSIRARTVQMAEAIRPALEQKDRLSHQLTNQRITTMQADSAHKNSELNLQVAQINLAEYTNGTKKLTLAEFDAEIEARKANILKFAQHVEYTKHVQKQIDGAPGTSRADILAQYLITRAREDDEEKLAKEKLSLESSSLKRKIFLAHDDPKRMMQLESEIEKAKADERAKATTVELEHQKEARLQRLMDASKVDPPQEALAQAIRAMLALDRSLAEKRASNAPAGDVEDLVARYQASLEQAESLFDQIKAKQEEAQFKQIQQMF